LLEQHRRHIGHAHRHAGMAGIGGGDGIERQHADRAGKRQWSGWRARRVAMSKALIRLEGKIKRVLQALGWNGAQSS
jgi:hypothetical protein